MLVNGLSIMHCFYATFLGAEGIPDLGAVGATDTGTETGTEGVIVCGGSASCRGYLGSTYTRFPCTTAPF